MSRKMISVLLYLGNFLKTVHPEYFLSEHLLEVGSRVQCIYQLLFHGFWFICLGVKSTETSNRNW